MADPTGFALCVIVVGVTATAVLDTWSAGRHLLSGTPAPDYGLVGRWLAWMPRGRFFHHPVSASPAIRGEAAIGWIAHYLIGIVFAGLLLAGFGPEWTRHPTIGPALAVGIGSVAAPFLLMQPGMGLGLAARNTPNPNAARLRSLVTHGVFGLGLYVGGWAASLLPH